MVESNRQKFEFQRSFYIIALIVGASALGYLERPWHEVIFFGVGAIVAMLLMDILGVLEAIRFMQAYEFDRKFEDD